MIISKGRAFSNHLVLVITSYGLCKLELNFLTLSISLAHILLQADHLALHACNLYKRERVHISE